MRGSAHLAIGDRSGSEMISAGDREQGAGRMSGGALGVERAAVINERLQFPAAVCNEHFLVHGRLPQRRKVRYFLIGQGETFAEIRVTQWAKFIDAGNREPRVNKRMGERMRRQKCAGGPAGKDHRSGDAVRGSSLASPSRAVWMSAQISAIVAWGASE